MSIQLTRSRALTACAATTFVLAAVAVLPVTEAAAAAPTAKVATSHVSQVRLGATISTLPRATVHHGGGAINLTEGRHLQRFANRSNSPRPKVVRNANGARTFAKSASPSWLPQVKPSPVSTTKPGTVKGWEGLNENDNEKYAGFDVEPPDQGLCAGGGRVLEMINDVVRVDSADGVPQRTAYINDLFKEPGYQFTTDPSCVFDAGTQRFYATELTLDVNPKTGELTEKNWLDLAVSNSSNPLNGWHIYRIDTTDNGNNGTPKHKNCPCIGDYPHIATDAHGVYLSTNEYPFDEDDPGIYGNNFNGAQVYALSKTRTAAGASTVPMVHLDQVRVPGGGPARPGFTLWPAQSPGTGYATANHGTIYFASSSAAEEARPADFTGHASQIGIWWLSNTASLNSTPHLTLGVKTLNVHGYGVPPLTNQKPGPVPLRDCVVTQCVDGLGFSPKEQEGGLDSLDSRVLTAQYVNGSVVTALDTAMQVSNNLQAGFQWFSVGANGASSTLSRQGYVGVAQGNAVFPTITTNRLGRGYVGFTLAGANRFPTAGYTTWSNGPGSALHVAAAGAAPQDGFSEYAAFNGGDTDPPSASPRWGDYGYAAWDGSRFFVANEYIAHSCSFARFTKDFTCGGTRTFYGNFSTHVQRLS